MSQDASAIEVKVGALVLVALVLLGGFVFVLGDVSFSSGKRFHIQFENAGGLKPGADLAVAGLKVGQVESLQFIKEDASGSDSPAVSVRATVRVNSEHADSIRKDSEFYISTRSVLGEKYVEVVTPTLESPPLERGATVEGVSPPRMDMLVSKMSQLLDGIVQVFKDPDISVDEFFANTASLVKHADQFLVDNRGQLDATIANAREAAKRAATVLVAVDYALGEGEDLRATLSNARSITDRLDGEVGPIAKDVQKTAENARRVSKLARNLVSEKKPKIERSIDNIHASSKHVKSLSGNADELVASIERGEGTVGQLLRDREIYDDMRELLRIIKRHPWKIMWKE